MHRAIAALALGLMALSVADYLMTVSGFGPYMALFTFEQVAYFSDLPFWIAASWAISAWFGLGGAVTLMSGHAICPWFWAISLLATVIYSGWLSGPGEMDAVTGPMGNWIMLAVVMVHLGFFLYARLGRPSA